MQGYDKQKNKREITAFQELSPKEGQRLVSAFVWLIEQDKKQNPALYESKGASDD